MTEVLVADDHRVFSEALATVLRFHGVTIIGSTTTVGETLEECRRLRPQVLLLDRRFPDGDGLDAVSSVLEASPSTRIVVLTSDPDQRDIARALAEGATGYLHKTHALVELVEAIQSVAAGEIVVGAGPPDRRGSDDDAVRRLASHMTERERQCLNLLVRGLGTLDMARVLAVSPTTVRSHVQALLTKLGAHSRLEAASLAVRHGLVTDELPRSAV